MKLARECRICARCLVFAGAWMTLARAGPPLQTDDPDTPGAGNWEINLAGEMERRGQAWAWSPLLDINYGWGERVQLKLKPRLAVRDGVGDRARSGAGNIQLGIKWRFIDQPSGRFAMSIYPQTDLNPPGHSEDRGLVDRGSDFLLPVQFAWKLRDAKIYGELGYAWREFRDDVLFAGLAFEAPLDAVIRWAGELRYSAEGGLGNNELLVNLGFKARLSRNCTFLASAGHTLWEQSGEAAGLFSYVGLQLTF